MTFEEMLGIISSEVRARIEARGGEAPELNADTNFLGGGLNMDSLDLATLLVALEEKTGMDPFSNGFINFNTAGELAKLYIKS